MLILLTTLTAEAKTLTVSTTQQIEAPADIVWKYVSDYETWNQWTVWNAEMDPEASWTYGGDAGAIGHSTEWTGPELGEGRMVVTAIEANQSVSYDLFFDGKDTGKTFGLILAEADGVTSVTWEGTLEMGPIGAAFFGKKIVSMIGDDFEGGLANLADLAAADATAAVLAAAEALVAETTAAHEAATTAVTDAEAAATAAAEAKTAAEEAQGKARRRSDKAAAQTALDEATAAVTAADEALAAAKTAADAAAAELDSAQAALAALAAPTEEAPAEEVPVEEAPAEEVPVEEAPAEEAGEDAPAEEAPAEEAPAAPAEEAGE
ncbi:MAG TPA: SRPBCC family protein [Myxococcota bacterium]|nr:SRPBCC family protein [Myxococcota bacterium]